jgi:CheY-like chemotaxis protein
MAKILVVDDEPLIREILTEMLSAVGHAVTAAESGLEGLAKLREGKFDLVTLDIDMPVMNGLETLKLLRRDPKVGKTPVLMVTAHNKVASLDASFENGANGYIIKPFDLPTLNKTISRALSAPV